MNPRKPEGDRNLPTFVARIWPEPAENGGYRWRGRVKHVQGNQERYFRGLSEMQEFLEEVADIQDKPANPDAA